MLREVRMFAVVCDRCGHELHDGDIIAWPDEEQATAVAHLSGWEAAAGKWYCPDCYTHSEDTGALRPYTKREKNMEKEPITQMEFDRRMVALREQYAAKLAAARDVRESIQRNKYAIQQQIHDLKARYMKTCCDLHEAIQVEVKTRREESDCRRALHDAFYHQHKPQMYQPFDTSMAYHVRQSVLNALKKALDGKCDTAKIQFNYTFGLNGEVEFKTVLPEIEI